MDLSHHARNIPKKSGLENRIVSDNTLNGYTAIILVLILGNLGILYSSLSTVRDHNAWVAHTHDVLYQLELTASGVKDTQTSMRGYILTRKEPFLTPYQNGRTSAQESVRKVKELTADNPVQQEKASRLRVLIFQMVQWQSDVIDSARREGTSRSDGYVDTNNLMGQDKERMDEIRLIVQDMKDTETGLLNVRASEAELASKRLDLSIMAAACVSLLLVLLARHYLRRSLQFQRSESQRLNGENWLKTGQAELSKLLRGQESMEDVGRASLEFFGQYLGMQVGAFYTVRHSKLLMTAAYARSGEINRASSTLSMSDSLVGEAVRQNRIVELDSVPEDYVKISSALGDSLPRKLVILPLTVEGEHRVGVVELGFLYEMHKDARLLFEEVQGSLGVAISSALARHVQQELLEETQRQAEELAAQQEELRASNEELETQANSLRNSQERLQIQQEELRQTNEELEQQARAVEYQKQTLSKQNSDLASAKGDLEEKARELEQASRYKSEFLANMSHELRTPLNSLLLLATLLAENKEKTLNDKQIDFAQTIFKSGRDLLALINDILDLSKVEAGHLDLVRDRVDMHELEETLKRDFLMTAQDRGLRFEVNVVGNAPRQFWTDFQRLLQILKNLISNALKFTPSGSVTVTISHGAGTTPLLFAVRDTGIGIAEDKKAIIFEAFKQSDGSINRTYGGTGLGLTISRELANLLGGHIVVDSKVGSGSTFTLHLPEDMPQENVSERPSHQQKMARMMSTPRPETAAVPISIDASGEPDLQLDLEPNDRLILVVEDDVEFGSILADIAREAGFKTALVTNGEAALRVAKRYRPAAVLLDIKLPDISGLSVLERLKADRITRHVPIHVISGADYTQNALALGAIGYLMKPARQEDLKNIFDRIETTLAKKVKRVLIVEDDKIQRQATKDLLGNGDIKVDEATSGAEARQKLWSEEYDCVVLDLRLPDISGFELLEAMEREIDGPKPPIVVYTAKDLTREEQNRLEHYAESIIIKGARSPERLLDEVSLFLHRLESSLPQKSQNLLQKMREDAVGLKGRRILLVDDDMRNVYALVAALETNGVKVAVARNGRESLAQLEKDETIELVLMDIMMPEMDGYEAMETIRKNPLFKKLPIIALTAKAMKGDLEQCLAAGANDYLPKPINLERLLSLLKVWLPQKI